MSARQESVGVYLVTENGSGCLRPWWMEAGVCLFSLPEMMYRCGGKVPWNNDRLVVKGLYRTMYQYREFKVDHLALKPVWSTKVRVTKT